MSALSKIYEKPSTSNKVFLMKRLFNIKMLEGWSVADNLNEFNTLTSQCWCIFNYGMYSLVYFIILYPDVYSRKYL